MSTSLTISIHAEILKEMKVPTIKTIFLLYLCAYILIGFVVFWPKETSISIPKQAPQPTPSMKQLTLESIFANDHTWIQTLPKKRLRTLVATGDVIPARSINYKAVTHHNFRWAFEKTADTLRSTDVTLINLETPLIANCQITVEGMQFCGDSRHIEGLLYAGIDVASLANNHAGDYGQEGILSTKKLLNDNGILFTGIAGPVFLDAGNTIFGFLGYNDIPSRGPFVSYADVDKIKTEITEAKQKADLIVVSFHWGTEYTTRITERQKELAHTAVDAGADLVIGNHPHWIQPVEFYKGKLITYAHGNFIFDQMWSEETKKGVIGRYTFFDNKLIDVEFFPVYIQDYGQPSFITGGEKDKLLEQIKEESIHYLRLTR